MLYSGRSKLFVFFINFRIVDIHRTKLLLPFIYSSNPKPAAICFWQSLSSLKPNRKVSSELKTKLLLASLKNKLLSPILNPIRCELNEA